MNGSTINSKKRIGNGIVVFLAYSASGWTVCTAVNGDVIEFYEISYSDFGAHAAITARATYLVAIDQARELVVKA